jgi:hypothetical protein
MNRSERIKQYAMALHKAYVSVRGPHISYFDRKETV